MSHSAEDGNSRRNGLAQRPNYPPEYYPVACAVKISTFLNLTGDRLDISLYQNDIVGRNYAGNDIYPERIRQVKGGKVHINGDKSRIEVHGNNDDPVPYLSAPQLLFGHKVACQSGGKYCGSRTDNSSQHGYAERAPDVVYIA